MPELADIFRRAGPRYRAVHAGQMLPSHQRAMRDIAECRTSALGSSLYHCDDCGALDYRYHSCPNRHCPKCQKERAQDWLQRTRERLLDQTRHEVQARPVYSLRASGNPDDCRWSQLGNQSTTNQHGLVGRRRSESIGITATSTTATIPSVSAPPASRSTPQAAAQRTVITRHIAFIASTPSKIVDAI